MLRHNVAKQNGAAIIYALLMVTIAASLSTLIALQTRLTAQTTLSLLKLEQAYDESQQLVAQAKLKLIIPSFSQPLILASILAPTQQISGELLDAQAKFNINNLLIPEYLATFKRLVKLAANDLSAQQIDILVLAITQWLTNQVADKQLHYLVSISELKLIPEMTPALYTKLAPYLVALPKVTPININSASNLVLRSLADTMTAAMVSNIVTLRANKPFTTTQDFLQLTGLANQAQITVISDYFLVAATISSAQQNNIFYTLLERQVKGTKNNIRILWQSFNIL